MPEGLGFKFFHRMEAEFPFGAGDSNFLKNWSFFYYAQNFVYLKKYTGWIFGFCSVWGESMKALTSCLKHFKWDLNLEFLEPEELL